MVAAAASRIRWRPPAKGHQRFRYGLWVPVVLALVAIQSACWLLDLDTGFVQLRPYRSGSPGGAPLAGKVKPVGVPRSQLTLARNEAGTGPLMPEKDEDKRSADMVSERYEKTFASFAKLWGHIKDGVRKGGKRVAASDRPLPKFFVLGINGANLNQIGHMLGTALDYVRTEGQAAYLFRDPVEENFTPSEYWFGDTEKEVQTRVVKAASDVFYDDLPRYRSTESQVLKDFNGYEDDGHPMVCVTGDGIALAEENRAILSNENNVAIWFDTDPAYNWEMTQSQPKNSGIWSNPQAMELNKPPVFALANGWDGDVDDVEGKEEFKDMCNERREAFEKVADVRIRVDVTGIKENPVWALEKIVGAMYELFGVKDDEEAAGTVGEENLSADLLTFLEGARLDKYHAKALEWCNENGAVSLDEVAENADDFAEAIGLKPLERKRFDKAASVFAPQEA